MFLSPKGLCKAEPEWSPFDSFDFIVVREECWNFQFTKGNSPFLNLENVLSPGGVCESSSQEVQMIPYFHFIGVGNGTGGFKNTGGERPF